MLLKLEDYAPINRDFVKEKWDEIMNVPNNEWEDKNIDRELAVINNTGLPRTLRLFQLNVLPALIIRIIDVHKDGF